MEKLKPCPFCGSEATVRAKSGNCGFIVWCECKNKSCGGRTVEYCADINEDRILESIERIKVKVVEIWNRRANDEGVD